MQTLTFKIDPASSAATIAKANKLCNRASNKGLSGGWKVVGISQVEERDPNTGLLYFWDVLTIEGEPFQFNGWTFVASIEWLEGKPFVATIPTYEGPEVDRAALVDGWCDHCQTKRRRNKVLIVEHPEQGRKQVGSNCVKDFLGHDIKVTYLAGPSEGDFADGIASQPYAADTVQVLAAAVAVIGKYGWVSKTQAHIDENTPTSHEVSAYLFDRGKAGQAVRSDVGPITQAHIDYATAVIGWVQDEWQGKGDYAENLRLAVGLKVTGHKTLGTLISAVSVFQKAIADTAARAAENITEDRYAPDGERITIEVEVTSVRYFQSDYGTFAYVTFKSATHRFKWKATGSSIPEQGATIRLTGTVKGVDEYNGAVFTVLTRCKFDN